MFLFLFCGHILKGENQVPEGVVEKYLSFYGSLW